MPARVVTAHRQDRRGPPPPLWGRPLVAWLALAAAAWSCARSNAKPPSPNRLVLELGGKGERLRDVLHAGRRNAGSSESERPPESADSSLPATPPPPAAPVEERTVVLRPGQTIYGLAREHLGSAARYREILARNGWTEVQAARLPAGTRVVLPR